MASFGNVFLIGPAGAGKTTVGRLVADALGLEFLDTDIEIESRSGVDIAWIFDLEGENGFRDREVRLIQELTERTGIVMATGGGAILREENRKRLVSRGTVVYLETPLERQIQRVSKDKNRPLLKGNDAEKRKILEAMHKQRSPLYQEIADLTLPADGSSARNLAAEIASRLSGRSEEG